MNTAPSPAEILAAAKLAVPAHPVPMQYRDAILVLKQEKFMTLKAIVAWFRAQGMEFSESGVHGALVKAESEAQKH